MATLEDLDEGSVKELALLARELSDNPDTRKGFLGLAKKVRPSMPVPELELDERLAADAKAKSEEIASLRNSIAERDLKDELARRRNAIKESRRINDEDVAEIEKIMLDKKIADHETAADYWDWMKQAAKPTPAAYDRSFLNKDNRSVLSKYWKNPAAAAREEAANAINDFKKMSLGRR